MKTRKPMIIANWKLNGGLDLICISVASFIGKHFDAQIAICPPYIYLRDMMTFLQYSELQIGSQNVSKYESGAYTGETSAQMLKEAGVSLCLIGHSERRTMFGESNQACFNKITRALQHDLLPVLCVGENREEREQQKTAEVLRQQLTESLSGLDLTGKQLCVAYEPIWAIGTGLAATPELAQQTHHMIRDILVDTFDLITANRIRILYGGSVTKHNAADLLIQKDIDGLLVGGASLDPEHFLTICEQASQIASDSRG
jgi:triosephosphate isomerase (TIM)